jgi:hypothetical protein
MRYSQARRKGRHLPQKATILPTGVNKTMLAKKVQQKTQNSKTPLVGGRRDDSDAIFESASGETTVNHEEEMLEVVAGGGRGNIQDDGNDNNRPDRVTRRGLVPVPNDFQPANAGRKEALVVINQDGQANQMARNWRRNPKIVKVQTLYGVLFAVMAGCLSTGVLPIWIRFVAYAPSPGDPMYEYNALEKVAILGATAFSAFMSGYTAWYLGNRRGTFAGLENDLRTVVGMQLQIWPYIEHLKNQNISLTRRWEREMVRREFLRIAEREGTEPSALPQLREVAGGLSHQQQRENRVQQAAVYSLIPDMKDTLYSIMENRDQAFNGYFEKRRSRNLFLILMIIGLLTFGYSIGFGFPMYLALNWNAIVSPVSFDAFIPFLVFGGVSAFFKAFGFADDAYNNNANDRLLLDNLPEVVEKTQLLIQKAEATLEQNNALVRELYPDNLILEPSSWNPNLTPDEYAGHQEWLSKHDQSAQFQPSGVPMAAGVPGSSALSGMDTNDAHRFFSVNRSAAQSGGGQRRAAPDQPLMIRDERGGPAPGRGGVGRSE